ncbi:MAG: hypothetical protein HKN70_01385 [Gammaproteobacteria bacterium]|nr:hypothetical protein [Gammaproteobacteria bacterium]
MRLDDHHSYRSVLAISVMWLCLCANAQIINSNLPIEVEADSTGADARSGTLTFTNIVIRQGNLRISAQQAESSALGFDDSVWTFSGDVVLSSPAAELQARSLVLTFAQRELTAAQLQGSPFRFRSRGADETDVTAATARVGLANNTIATVTMQGQPIAMTRLNPETGQLTSARANAISYDASSKTLELTGDAELNEDGNMITGSQITYSLDGQTVLAAGDEDGGDRVHITIRPRDEDTEPPPGDQEAPTTDENADATPPPQDRSLP